MSPAQNIYNLDDIVDNWAWNMFKRSAISRSQKRMKREQLDFEILWDRITFDNNDPTFTDSHSVKIPNAQTLFITTFDNRTGEGQRYSFQVNRTTKSTASVTVQSGFTVEKNLGVKLSVPGSVLEANAGYKTQLSLSNTKSQNFEEDLNWGINSEVMVGGNSSTLAEVKITETKYDSNFTIDSYIRGEVRVIVHNRKKANQVVKLLSGDIVSILSKALEGQSNVFPAEDQLHIRTTGACIFRYGCEQSVVLRENALVADA